MRKVFLSFPPIILEVVVVLASRASASSAIKSKGRLKTDCRPQPANLHRFSNFPSVTRYASCDGKGNLIVTIRAIVVVFCTKLNVMFAS